VTEERPHRAATEESEPLVRRWLGHLAGGRDPRLPRPHPPHLPPVRRAWLASWWQARIAVRAGVPVDPFLRARLARYVAALPVPQAQLPLSVSVEDGQIAVRPAAPPPPPLPPEADGWIGALVAAEGPAIRQEAQELEIRLSSLDGEIEAARRRTDELARRLAADVAAGHVVETPSVDATPEQLGRPEMRSAAVHGTMLLFAAAALAAETWQLAVPLLRAAGLEVGALALEASRRPADVLFVGVFALAVAAGLFALAHVGLGALVAAHRTDGDARRRRWLLSGGAGAGAISTVVTAALAALPSARAGGMPRWSFVVLLLAVPLAAALVLRGARREGEVRAAEAAAALAWDRQRAKELSERARRSEEVSLAQAEERDLERRRESARRRLRDINARAVEADRLAQETDRRERAALSRVALSVVAALELDHDEFVRQASARGASELLARRPELRRDGTPTPLPSEPRRAAS
jgi:hypothetical protein